MPSSEATHSRTELRIVDLFCGCGGMTLGIVEAARRGGLNASIALAMDMDPDVVDVYRANLGHLQRTTARHPTSILEGDVREVFGADLRYARLTDSEREIRWRIGKVDVLVGGPPCQGHSDLNNRTRRADSRNELYATMARAARALEPELLVVENVPTVVHDRNRVVQRTKYALELLGYSIAARVVGLDGLGVPQRRRRHLLIATKRLGVAERVLDEVLRRSEQGQRTVRWAISDLEATAVSGGSGYHASSRPTQTNAERMQWLVQNDADVLPDQMRPDCHRLRPHSYKSVYGRMRWDHPAQTITTGFLSMGQGCYVHPGATPRTITPQEAARLQTFPDFFRFDHTGKRTAWAKMIGNAVPPLVTLAIGEIWLSLTGRARRASSS